ncbi:MAG TPA: hypothetical protein VFU21_20740 [Kofleriaceae bacterium]|nr:hypothetical protein [Kofleriaceae bacterium]
MMRLVWPIAVAAALAACGGTDVPTHSGYKTPKATPWRKPTVLLLDDQGEAEVDDSVSYPQRSRARWFAVDLPTDGHLEIQVQTEPHGDRDVDLAFEVLNEGYEVLVRADRDEEDAGEEQKSRKLAQLRPGRYYIHVYAQRRLDEADFTLGILFRPGAAAARASNFPASVAFVGALPDVPAVDDAPPPGPPPKKPCKGPKCKKRPPEPPPDTPDTPPKAVRARVAGIVSATAGGTQIRIDRGSAQGVAVGWKGSVESRDGKPIAGGSFEVSRVTAAESFGTVRASANSVTEAKYVRLRPP